MGFREIEYLLVYRPHDNPLATFYLPTLAAAVHYDRSAGYFSSTSLAVAAAGIVRLIANGGRMRLMVGAQLFEEDVAAMKQGYDLRELAGRRMLAALPQPDDWARRERLAALTWMVAAGRLDVRVVLPLDTHGFPIPGEVARDYYHPKTGVFTDANGDQVAFVGSVNESAQAWEQRNYEMLDVACSWRSEESLSRVASYRATFNEVWNGHDPDWLAVELPDAVRDELIKRAPARPPTRDPLEQPDPTTIRDGRPKLAVVTPTDQALFQFVRDAPTLINAGDLAAATSAVRPWPHQMQVARTIIGRFPDRALLCDEVGLGKTIEAGLIIRHLLLSGRVRRALILTPKAVLRQWQEELYEKFNLAIPRYDGGQLLGVYDAPLGPPPAQPWADCDLLLASSQLARRQERVAELVAAPRWDLLVIDEAHHARRRDFLQPHYRPNRLLTLLNQLKAADRYDGLLLMTATPMQVHPVEVWDLLTALGLSGRWGADERAFLDFFAELRKQPADTDWDFVYGLVADYLRHVSLDGQIDPVFGRAMLAALGAPRAEMIRALPHNNAAGRAVRALPSAAQHFAAEMARQHTPLQRYVFRNTRALLRSYVAKGLLDARVPTRRPRLRRVAFRADEAELYGRITEYISQFYARYESERRGLGFIMTVYRRRLTSSFYAVRRSLERRRDFLLRQIPANEAFTADDEAELDAGDELEQAGLSFEELAAAQTSPGVRAAFQAELAYLETFINDLRRLSGNDSKVDVLKDELDELFLERTTALIFTQYTDTMDYLRDHLLIVYGTKVACYSGRGGEVWNGLTWVTTPKEQVKEQFRNGELAVLICTESASEGLNLQTCGILINYDMPWNPMRVEQRIGRIDRIGQTYAEVWISNYFYEDSIEDKVYQALADRIHWFEDVVGALQPILAEVGEVTRQLAMLPAQEQAARFESEMRELRRKLEEAQINALNIDDYVELDDPNPAMVSPVIPADLEELLTTSPATRHLFTPHETIDGAWWLRGDGPATAATFRAELFDRWPQTLQFLSYGSPLLAAVLAYVAPPDELPAGVARHEAAELPLRGWYELGGPAPGPIASLGQLRLALAADPPPPSAAVAAQAAFAAAAAARTAQDAARRARTADERRAVLEARARQLAQRAALVEIALGHRKSLFDDQIYPISFNEAAVAGLWRHQSPWSWIVHILEQTGAPLPLPQEADPFFEQIRNDKPERLKERFVRLTGEAEEIAKEWQGKATTGDSAHRRIQS